MFLKITFICVTNTIGLQP